MEKVTIEFDKELLLKYLAEVKLMKNMETLIDSFLLEVIKQNGWAIKYIENPTEEMKKIANQTK